MTCQSVDKGFVANAAMLDSRYSYPAMRDSEDTAILLCFIQDTATCLVAWLMTTLVGITVWYFNGCCILAHLWNTKEDG